MSSNDHTTILKISEKRKSVGFFLTPPLLSGGKGLNYIYICHIMAPVPHPNDATIKSMIVPVWTPDNGPCGMPGKGPKGLCPSSMDTAKNRQLCSLVLISTTYLDVADTA
jgi:hypothetical protein